MKDVEKEKKEKEQTEKDQEEKISWFQKVPSIYKLAGIGIIFVKYLALNNSGGDIKELFTWTIVVLIIWYFLGSDNKRRDTDILSPHEAEDLLEKEIERKRKKGQIPRWANTVIGPNNGLFHHEGMPQHYQIGVEIITQRSRDYKRGVVHCEGPTRGFVTIQDSIGQLTGREPIPVRTPKIFKDLKKYDIDMDKFLFGEKK